ncbi:MAG TPA: 2-keto-4-pentenoate hydratase, partial [Solirubrobacteraceae bacterium]|nr:2-keto-4-pentenoate hydratase [Solirubrobacteraceae bacterium]
MIETTTLTPQDLDRLALALQVARDRREPIAPLTETLPDLSVTDAYAIAERNVAARVAAGAAIVGHKIGLTSPAVQEQLGVDQPDYGTLLDAMRIADGASVEAGAFIAPRIELELA